MRVLRDHRCSPPRAGWRWQAWPGRTHQTFRSQSCRGTFSARRDTPLYRLKTPSQQVAMVLTALAEGLDPSAAEGVLG
jgi:transposase-like protein